MNTGMSKRTCKEHVRLMNLVRDKNIRWKRMKYVHTFIILGLQGFLSEGSRIADENYFMKNRTTAIKK